MKQLIAVGCLAAWLVTGSAVADESSTSRSDATGSGTVTFGNGGAGLSFGGATVAPGTGAPLAVFHYAGPDGASPWNTVGVAAEDEETMKLKMREGELSQDVSKLLAKYRELKNDDDRSDAEKQIGERVAEQFDIRQKLREKQLAALEDQVKRLRKVQDERAEQRRRIVTDRVQQLLRDAAGLGWGDTGSEFGSQLKVKPGVLSLTGPGGKPARTVIKRTTRDGDGPMQVETKDWDTNDDSKPKEKR